MEWFHRLYAGRLIASRREEIVRDIDAGKTPSGVYLLALPENQRNLLEFYSAKELKNPYLREHPPMIVGIAFGKDEALFLTERIVSDVYRARGDVDVRAWICQMQG